MAVTFTAENAVGVITLDNPPANSYDLEMMSEFAGAVDEAIESDVKSVILRSASDKFFSAGADVKKFLDGDVDSNMEMIRTSQGAFRRMAAAPQVFLVEIAGHALGGGLEIALACDLRYAAGGEFMLGTPEITLGLLPGNGGTQRLPRLIGPARAMDLLLTGRTFSPQEALAMGLVSELFPADETEDRVRAVAERFATGPTLALAAIKRCVYEGAQQQRIDDGLALEGELVEGLFSSQDAHEGMTAFVAKRQPEFVGR